MYKIAHSQASVALTEIFENSQQIYNLRNNEFKLYLRKPNIYIYIYYIQNKSHDQKKLEYIILNFRLHVTAFVRN